MILTVPWPPKELSPNARVHWGAKSRAAKNYRSKCYLLAKQSGLCMPAGKAVLSLTFCPPPTKRKRDDDNLIAAFKAGRDGIADALRIDDNSLTTMFRTGEPVQGGAVQVEILRGTV